MVAENQWNRESESSTLPEENVAIVERLLGKHEGRIRRFLVRRSGPLLLSRTTIDDLYQETAVTVLQSAARFVYIDEPRSLRWIYVIASRVISHALHDGSGLSPEIRISKNASTVAGVRESAIPGKLRTPSSAVSADEEAGSLRRAIMALPRRHREVLTLYRIEERSLSEVAQYFKLSKNGAARLIGRALESLRLSLRK